MSVTKLITHVCVHVEYEPRSVPDVEPFQMLFYKVADAFHSVMQPVCSPAEK